MEISKIEFGSIDARNEIITRSESKKKLFLDSFVLPPSFKFSELLDGEKYLICGPKGSGKTAFLRYLHSSVTTSDADLSRFIVFRDEVTGQQADKLFALSRLRVYDGDEASEEVEYSDCMSAWQLFIHREIAFVISRNGDKIAKTNDVKTYIQILNSVFTQFKTSAFKKMLQSINRGKIKVNAFVGTIEAEVEFIDRHGNLDVAEFVRFCNAVTYDLDFSSELHNPRINIFFDELNINFVSGKEFKRNAVLIRDLVAACGSMNLKFAENNVPIYIYTAIRTEVVDSIESNVRELRKWIDDKAVHLDWIRNGIDYSEQPIMQLLQRRIAANEKRENSSGEVPKNVDLTLYFERDVRGYPFHNFLIFETWGRPRDIVRLLTLASQYVEKGKKFSTRAFELCTNEYSRGCWEEKKDELNTKYSQSMIESIRKLLMGLKTRFTRQDLDARISFQMKNDPRTKQFFHGRNIDLFLEDLFKVGVIGSLVKTRKGHMPAFQYMGHTNFDPNERMCVHNSLWRELNIDVSKQSGPLAKGLSKKRKNTNANKNKSAKVVRRG